MVSKGVIDGFWPDGYRCCFFLSFDYDSSSAEMWKTPNDIVSQSKGAYAHNVAIPRILDMLEELQVKTTFFVPGWTADNHPASVKEIVSRGHEVGAHGYMHERITEVSWEAERSIFDRSMESLSAVGAKPVGYRAPYWLVSDRTVGHLKRLGFKYSSNFMDNDMPYMLSIRGEETGLVELPVEWLLTIGPTSRRIGRAPTRFTGSGSPSSKDSMS